eukprot:1032496_1
MLLYLIRLICFPVFEVSALDAPKPTIINSTGEYYIANTATTFNDQTIECNSSIPNCFVVCDQYESCTETTIRAPNSINSSSLYLYCSDSNSCNGAVVYGSENPDSFLRIECSGVDMWNGGSCHDIYVDTMHSNQSSIICSGSWPCCRGQINSNTNMNNISYLSIDLNANGSCSSGLTITPSDLTVLDLQFHGRQIPWYETGFVGLYRSSLNNMTSITCHEVDSCLNLFLAIPPSSHYEFNANVVVNGRNIDTFGYSYFNIYCTNDTVNWDPAYGAWPSIACTNDTPFPIFDIAEPSNSSGNSVHYISEDLYWYRYQTFILDEKESNMNDYVIECTHDYSCSQTFIQFTTNVDSNCAISCTGDYSCAGYKVYSMPTNNSNISMLCQGHHVCGVPVVQENNYKAIIYPSITTLSGQELTFSLYDTTPYAIHPVLINGSDSLSMYINLTRKWMCDTVTIINGTNAKALHLKLDNNMEHADCMSSQNLIYSPISVQAIFDLSCANYGCLWLKLWVPNDLSDVNVSFTGDCGQCHVDDDHYNRTNCIDEWTLHCGNETRGHLDNYLRCEGDDDVCCTDDDAKDIQNAYSEYWVGFECPNRSNHHETLFIISISGGCALFCLFVLLVVWCKYCKKKYQGAATEYHPIGEA